MPTVYRWKGYRFYFYADERQEPPHIHIEHGENDAKIWLDSMTFAYAYGFTTKQQREILDSARMNIELLRTAWHEFHFGRR